jgi:hypothetical protein
MAEPTSSDDAAGQDPAPKPIVQLEQDVINKIAAAEVSMTWPRSLTRLDSA